MGDEGHQRCEVSGCDGVVGAPLYPALHLVDAAAVHPEEEVPGGQREEANGDGGAVEGDEVGLEDDVEQGVHVDVVVQVPHRVLLPQHLYLELQQHQHHKCREVDEDYREGVHSLQAGIRAVSDLHEAVG